MPLLHHAVLRVSEVCQDVVVVLAPDAPEPAAPRGVRVRFAHDARAGQGPLAGLFAGLSLAGSELALVVAGDMPELQVPVLLEMLRIADDASSEAVTLQDGDRFRPLPCVVRRRPAFGAAGSLLRAGGRRLRDLLGSLANVTIDEQTWTTLDPGRRTLIDVDEPADLPEG